VKNPPGLPPWHAALEGGPSMHPVAVKCIKWAVGLFIFGGLMAAYGVDVLV